MTARALDWTGAIDHITWSTAGNWNDLATGVAALASPANTDLCYISSTGDKITAGLSNTGVQLAELNIGAGFTGNIGAAGTSLLIGIDKLVYNGRCAICNLSAGTGGITRATIGGFGTVSLVAGTTATAAVSPGGTLDIGASATVTNLQGAGGGCTAAAGAAFTSVRWTGGALTSARNLGTIIMSNPGAVVKTTGTATITTGDVGGGTTLIVDSTGTITTLYVHSGGTTSTAGASRPFAITNSTKFSGGTLFSESMSDITYTNPPNYAGFDS